METTQNKISSNIEINLNIDRDDYNSELIYCWSVLGFRPSKIVLFSNFIYSKFQEIVNKYQLGVHSTTTDIIPVDNGFTINEKLLIELKDNFFATYTVLDQSSNTSIVSDVTIYYSLNSEGNSENIDQKIDDFINDISQVIAENNSTKNDKSIFSLGINQGMFSLTPLTFQSDIEDTENYFNTKSWKKSNKLIKEINRNQNGLSIILGERGVGKTLILNHIATEVSKNVIYVPFVMIDHIMSGEFINLLDTNKNSVIIIDDCESNFDSSNHRSDVYTTNILQIVDGYNSMSLNCNIILGMNLISIDDIDENLLQCNNLIDVINIKKMKPKKAKQLSKILKIDNNYKSPVRLIDVVRGNKSYVETKIGFK